MKLRIGTDIEVAINKSNRWSSYFLDTLHITYDHRGRIGEIVTPYDRCPKSHYKRIELIIRLLKRINNDQHPIVSGSSNGIDKLGGHIHFSNIFGENKIKYTSSCLDMLITLPYFTIVNKNTYKFRIHNRDFNSEIYARLSNYRSKKWGFEYRTLPSFIYDPDMTKSILCLAYCIAYDVILGKEIYNINCIGDNDKNDLIDNYNKVNQDYVYKYKSSIIHAIKCLSLYPKYSKEINFLLNIFENEGKIDDSKPFLPNWNCNIIHHINVTNRFKTIKNVLGVFKCNERVKIIKIPQSFITNDIRRIKDKNIFWCYPAPYTLNNNTHVVNDVLVVIFRKMAVDPSYITIGFTNDIKPNQKNTLISSIKEILKLYKINIIMEK